MFDLVIDSDLRLPELPPARGAPSLSVRASHGAGPRRGWRWVERNRRRDGVVWLAIARRDDDWLLRFPRLAEFELCQGASLVLVRRGSGVPLRTLRHLLIDVVVPMALSAQGHLLLHASGVTGRRGAALFLGRTGAGKSTLAASFTRPFRGFADDAVRVVQRGRAVHAASAYGGARLWPDALSALNLAKATARVAHYSAKRRVSGPRPGLRPAIRVVYVLQRAAARRGVVIRPCSRRRAVVELLGSVYCLDPGHAAAVATQFDRVVSLTGAFPVFTLAFPRDLNRLPDVRAAIESHFRAVAADE